MSRLFLSHPDLRSQVIVLALPTVLFLPFLNQAVHMDDSIYLDIARNVLRNPLNPHDFPYCFEGYCAPDMASHSHPPFIAYWLAAWLKLSGGSLPEWALHATYLPFIWLFAVSVFFLAKRFSRKPLLCSLIIVSTPVAVVMSHNLMADYPNLACWTAALALFIAGVDHRRSGWIWISSLFMVISSFTSYPSLIIPLLCWTYAAQMRPGMRAAMLAPVIPFLWMGLWLGYSSAYFGRFVLGGTGRYFIESRGTWTFAMLMDKFLAFPVFLAGTVVMPWNLIVQACRWISGRIAILAILISAAITQLAVPAYSFAEKALFGCLFLIGVLAITALAAGLPLHARSQRESNRERNDSLFLLIWLGTVALLVLFLYAAASARYLLPLAVPFILLSGNSVWRFSPHSASTALKVTLALGILVSLMLSVADYQAAASNKDLADELKMEFDGWEGHVRFGAEWGLRHYLQENGYRQYISTSDDFRGGDFVLVPEVAIPYSIPQDVESMSFVVSRKIRTGAFPIRLVSRKAHAGFYSSGWGLLPFSFSIAPLEIVTVLQVSMLIEKLPEIRMVGNADMRAAIPLRGAAGQADLQLPFPFGLAIPYSGPAANVIFEWRQPLSAEEQEKGHNVPGQVPEFAASTHTGFREQSLAIHPSGAWKKSEGFWAREYRFELPALLNGDIRFGIDSPNSLKLNRVILRNWRVLPKTKSDDIH